MTEEEFNEILGNTTLRFAGKTTSEKEPMNPAKIITSNDLVFATKVRTSLRHAEAYMSEDDFKVYDRVLKEALINGDLKTIKLVQEKASEALKGDSIRPVFHEQDYENRKHSEFIYRDTRVNRAKIKSQNFVKRVKQTAITILCIALVAGGITFLAKESGRDADNSTADRHESAFTQSWEGESSPTIESLKDLQLQYSKGTTLTSDSVKKLSNAVVSDLNDLYDLVMIQVYILVLCR